MAGIILEKLLVSTIIILAASLMRYFVKNRFGSGWMKVLWGMIAMWMLLPVSFSFDSRLGYHQDILLLNHTAAIEAGYTFLEYVPDLGGTDFQEVPVAYFMIIFAAVVAVIKILYHYRQYGFAVNRLIDSTTGADGRLLKLWDRVCEEQNIRKKIPVYCSITESSPMIIGCFSPVLILPENLCREQENVIYDILRHEAVHYKSGDLWYKKLLLLVSDVYWYDPFIYLMRKLACEDVEFTCDEQVTKSFDDEEKRKYCNSILNLADAYRKPNVYAAEFSVDARRLKTRIENVFTHKKTKKGIAAAVMFVVILLVMAGMVDIRTIDVKYIYIQDMYIQGEEDIQKNMNVIDRLYFSENDKLGEVRIAFAYDSSQKPVNRNEIGESLHIVVACEKYDELSNIMIEGIEAVFKLQYSNDVDVRIIKLEP